MPPMWLGRSRVFPKDQAGQGRRIMAVRCVFCHPEQPQDSEDGVTCGWNEVLFGFKTWPGTGLYFSVPQALRFIVLGS